MGRCIAGGVLLTLAIMGLAHSDNVNASASVESELLGLVNGGRSSPVALHSGLLSAARGHSRDMSARGGLSHSGTATRILGAEPDPLESNGAPDDGYRGRYCENVAYVGGVPAESVAQRVYQGWRSSPTHLRCMTSADMNAGAVGVHFDGSRWWATLDLIRDGTPPGSPNSARTPGSAGSGATAAPAASLPAAPARRKAAEASPGPITSPTPTAADTTPHDRLAAAKAARGEPTAGRRRAGWPEILAGIGIAMVSVFAYRRLSVLGGRES